MEPYIECEGTKIWRDQVLDKGFRNTNAEIGVTRTVENKSKEK
jgi:hypothetical protein